MFFFTRIKDNVHAKMYLDKEAKKDVPIAKVNI